MPEHHDEASQTEASAKTEEEAGQKGSLFDALGRTFHGLEISLQNILTLSGTIIIPLVAYVFGFHLAVAIAVGLSLVIWFLVCKALKYARSRVAALAFGFATTILLIGSGFGISIVKTKPLSIQMPQPPIPGRIDQKAEDSPCSNVVAGGGVSINCPPSEKKSAPAKKNN